MRSRFIPLAVTALLLGGAVVAAPVVAPPASAAVPTITVDDVTHAEGDAGTTSFTFTVSLDAPSDGSVLVDYATTAGSATAGSDYVAISGTILFALNQTTATETVLVNGDTATESDETFTLQLSNPINATLADASGTGTIVNDDLVGALSVTDVTTAEGNAGTTSFTFTVSLAAAVSKTVTVDYATADGSASAGSDYGAISGTIVFTPGQASTTETVFVNGDTAVESDETFALNLSNPTNAILTDASGLGTIVNDDVLGALSVSDVTLAEGNAGTTAFTFTVSLAAPVAQSVTVDYGTAGNTASAGSDYAAISGTILFTPGQTSTTETVLVNGDTTVESDETFNLNLSSPVGATLADASGTGTILNDDALGALSVSDVTLAEGDAGTTAFTFTVSLAAPVAQTVSVAYATADGSASAGSDYGAISGTIVLAPGETTRTEIVMVNGDTTLETDETFTLNLSSPVGAALVNSFGTGTIVNDEVLPTIDISPASTVRTEGAEGTTTTVTFTVARTVASPLAITVTGTGVDGTATQGSDFTAPATLITIPASAGPASATVSITILGDNVHESDEQFTYELSNPTNATLGAAVAAVTITDDDPVAPVGGASALGVTGTDAVPMAIEGAAVLLLGLALVAFGVIRRRWS